MDNVLNILSSLCLGKSLYCLSRINHRSRINVSLENSRESFSFSLMLLTIELKFARATFFENKSPYGLSLSLPPLPFSGTKERWKSHLSPRHCMQIRVGDNSQGPTDRASRASYIALKKRRKGRRNGTTRRVPERSPASFSFLRFKFPWEPFVLHRVSYVSYCTRHTPA